ncbi:hypothetical protein MEG1DRAFT_01029 [Photorhabdus temperata subsp. temperata Meg1]|uniref:Uncharacterized protein n=2 Tax=Photorhabdus temperata TaxID=574560 RepID=A0A081S006_PHOTE|nr:hypothetical protein O185_06220 [Photorhabdus temperata J3]KER04259.1 hypothetical protein MEG1DRAFT_01029 [Photorhabdus temperata subsp. temperata Meg1]
MAKIILSLTVSTDDLIKSISGYSYGIVRYEKDYPLAI